MKNISFARFARAFFIFVHFAAVLDLFLRLCALNHNFSIFSIQCSNRSNNSIPLGFLEYILRVKWLEIIENRSAQKREVTFSDNVLDDFWSLLFTP